MEPLQSASKAATCIYHCFPVLATIDWVEEARLIFTAVLICISILIPIRYVTYLTYKYQLWFDRHTYFLQHPDPFNALLAGRLFSKPHRPPGRGTIVCGPSRPVYDSSVCVVFNGETRIYAWPSKGGMILYDHATFVDFEFLGLNPLDPPPTRLADQDEEDIFCQKMLKLGAVWYDSEARYQFLRRFVEHVGSYESPIDTVDKGLAMPPTSREDACVWVGWPSTGGFWVKEWSLNLYCVDEEKEYVPEDTLRLELCRNMDERCEILSSRFGAKWYADIGDYERAGFLDAWRWKKEGEVGSLQLTYFNQSNVHGKTEDV